MSNVNESKQNFVHLIANKLLKEKANFVEKKNYFLSELSNVEY